MLVVSPAALRDGPWKEFAATQNLPIERISFEGLTQDTHLNPNHPDSKPILQSDPSKYALIIIDEAHNLRNPNTRRAEALRNLLAGTPPKTVVLLTATPVNNTLWDLYHQLGFFVRNDAAFADTGIPSLRHRFEQASEAAQKNISNPDMLFDLLDAVTVRRTRQFVKQFYPHDSIPTDRGGNVTLRFPTTKLKSITYNLEDVLPDGFFTRFQHALEPGKGHEEGRLTLAIYNPGRYSKAGESHREKAISGLLKSGLLKRFESSPQAFRVSCERLIHRHNETLKTLDTLTTTETPKPPTLDWVDIEDYDTTETTAGTVTTPIHPTTHNINLMRTHLKQDLTLLTGFLKDLQHITPNKDTALKAVTNRLRTIADTAQQLGIGETDTRNRRKTIIFTSFADTAEWVRTHLEQKIGDTNPEDPLAAYQNRVTSLTGSSNNKTEPVWGFAPDTAAPSGANQDKYDILVTTDVLAEGVNLQQAAHIINYDLPWNPMRLVQRHGRIDRIGSAHKSVTVHCVFPDRQLESLLNLEQKLQQKIRLASSSVGVAEILPGQPTQDINFSQTREEIQKLRDGDTTLLETGGTRTGLISGETFRQTLRNRVEELGKETILKLPAAAGSGMITPTTKTQQPGWVFCATVKNSDQPEYRHIVNGEIVSSDTLQCLDLAEPEHGPDHPQHLPNNLRHNVYEMWETARTDIVENWNKYTDKAFLEPEIPVPLLNAGRLLYETPPTGLTDPTQLRELIAKLEAPSPNRVVTKVQNILRSPDNPQTKTNRLKELADQEGLQPYHAPPPRKPITPEDVQLCAGYH